MGGLDSIEKRVLQFVDKESAETRMDLEHVLILFISIKAYCLLRALPYRSLAFPSPLPRVSAPAPRAQRMAFSTTR